jgi:hypothetical protein
MNDRHNIIIIMLFFKVLCHLTHHYFAEKTQPARPNLQQRNKTVRGEVELLQT